MRQSDGRGPATALTALILERLALADPAQLIHEVYDQNVRQQGIAALAPLVQRAHDAGDAVASGILERAAGELVAAAASVISRLGMRGHAFPTVLAGGIFKAVPWLATAVTAGLSEVAPRTHPAVLSVEPAVGAVRLALAEARGGASLPDYI
jgi:N-acetylglucosamine kinase-like BadF-type ATPase